MTSLPPDSLPWFRRNIHFFHRDVTRHVNIRQKLVCALTPVIPHQKGHSMPCYAQSHECAASEHQTFSTTKKSYHHCIEKATHHDDITISSEGKLSELIKHIHVKTHLVWSTCVHPDRTRSFHVSARAALIFFRLHPFQHVYKDNNAVKPVKW